MSRALVAVLAAQFLSALADNALLFGALALLREQQFPDWSAPLLQEFFVIGFIVLAPFVGGIADAYPKGRVMLIANGVKLFGALSMWAGVNPFLAYSLVGLGATTFSPAKYGILSEIVRPEQLVMANGLLEGSTIAAILAGAIAGGALADWDVSGALASVTLCYALAASANLLIPRLPAAHPQRLSAVPMIKEFASSLGQLFRLPDARFSLVGTSLFWGTGATMRFLVIAWVPVALGIVNTKMPAYLNAVVAVGIVIGAACAGRWVSLAKVNRVLPAGVLLGAAVILLALTHDVYAAFTVMVTVGACGGFFIVPLNALLQEKGHETIGAGHAIAVQNLLENVTMLLMIGLYTLALRAGFGVTTVALGFGLFLVVAMSSLWRFRLRKRNNGPASGEGIDRHQPAEPRRPAS